MHDSLSWNFDRVFEFSKAFDEDAYITDDELSLQTEVVVCEKHDVPTSLGDFSRIYTVLGISPPLLDLRTKPLDSPPDLISDRPSSPSSLSEPAEDFDAFITGSLPKGVRWPDELQVDYKQNYFSPLTTRHNDGQLAVDIVPGKPASKPSTPAFELIPASVLVPSSLTSQRTFFPPPLEHDFDPLVIRPLKPVTGIEQKKHLVRRLKKRYKDSSFTDGSIEAAIYAFGATNSNGVHVFIDFSNIIIGFCNKIKAARGLHEKAFVRQPPMSFHSLALILERGRPVARRCLVGSSSKTLHSQPGTQKVPKHFSEAEICGYELNILDRVSKLKPVTPIRRKKNGTGNGYATVTSGDESATAMDLKKSVMAEQGVDEILHMKILESIIDYSEPTTIVLASGDAAEAEYSGGFFKTVQRALTKGWSVEILAWRDGLSREYQNREFTRKWGDKFRVIQLDEFAEDMLAIYDD